RRAARPRGAAREGSCVAFRFPVDARPAAANPLPQRMSEEDPRSDEELARRAGQGDAQAFEALYLRHKNLVFGLARRFAGAELASDVVQEVFAYLVKRLPGLEFRGRLATFLYPVVKHVAAAERRREGRHARSDGVEPELLPAEN